MLFEFLDLQDETSMEENNWMSDQDEEEGSEIENMTERKIFWDSLHQQLQETLLRRTSTEVKIQRDTEEIVRRLQSTAKIYKCDFKECVVKELREMGYNSAVCKSSWNTSLDTPAGEHTYIDVIHKSRIIVELNFKSEFETVRSCTEYSKLMCSLPEIFVGKADKLKGVVKVMCSATKKSMKGNNMHIAPWRKYRYMQSKWLAKSERVVSSRLLSVAELAKSERRLRAGRSILTFDSHFPAFGVV